MQMKKAGVVATGALATVAVMGAPAAAAFQTTDVSALTKATPLMAEGVHHAKAAAMREIGEKFKSRNGDDGWFGWDAPWDTDPQATTSTGSGSVTNTNPFQSCGSTAADVASVATATSSPNSVLAIDDDEDGYGDDEDEIACANGNVDITQTDNFPLTGVLNDSATLLLTHQACGSTAAFAGGVATSLVSANTVFGDCDNGNVDIDAPKDDDDDDDGDYNGWEESARTEGKAATATTVRKVSLTKPAGVLGARQTVAAPKPVAHKAAAPKHAPATSRNGDDFGFWGWDAPWDQDPFGLASAQSGSALLTSTDQICGSTGATTIGVATATGGANTVVGDCRNANSDIDKLGPKAAISISDNAVINLLPNQICGSTAGVIGGIATSVNNPNTVIGSCFNANASIG